jgi:hypothetical protein
MRPKKEHHEEEDKFLQSKRVIDKHTLKLKHSPSFLAQRTSLSQGSSEDGASTSIPLKIQSFKIPKKKDPERAKLFQFTTILKQNPKDFIPNDEASDDLRGELERKVGFDNLFFKFVFIYFKTFCSFQIRYVSPCQKVIVKNIQKRKGVMWNEIGLENWC